MNGKSDYDWITLARRLQSIARAGLEYCHNDFDRDRYEVIRELALEILEKNSNNDFDHALETFGKDTGYPTPKVDVRAAIFRDDRILLIREKLDGKWALPGGWADPHISLRENLVKESFEEAGARVEPERILAVHDRSVRNYPPIPHGCYKIFVKCKYLGGEFHENTETEDARFFALDDLPELSTERNVMEQIEMCFRLREGGEAEFD